MTPFGTIGRGIGIGTIGRGIGAIGIGIGIGATGTGIGATGIAIGIGIGITAISEGLLCKSDSWKLGKKGGKGVPNVRGSLELLNSEFKVRVQLEL